MFKALWHFSWASEQLSKEKGQQGGVCVHAGWAPPLSCGRGTDTTGKPDWFAGVKGSQLEEGLGLAGAREQPQEAGRKRAGVS